MKRLFVIALCLMFSQAIWAQKFTVPAIPGAIEEAEYANYVQDFNRCMDWLESHAPSATGKYTAIKIRNQCAHSDNNDDFWQALPELKEQFEKIKKNKRKCQKIINKDSTNKAKRSFEKHADSERFGDKQNRKKTVNALEDAFDNKIDKSDKSEFPSASEMISKTVGNISEETKKYVCCTGRNGRQPGTVLQSHQGGRGLPRTFPDNLLRSVYQPRHQDRHGPLLKNNKHPLNYK